MEIVNIEARTFEAMLSAFRTFADRLDTLCRLYGDMEEKKWLDNQEVCLLLKVSPRTLQTLRDNGTLAYTQICHKTYYKPEDHAEIFYRKPKGKRGVPQGRTNFDEEGENRPFHKYHFLIWHRIFPSPSFPAYGTGFPCRC